MSIIEKLHSSAISSLEFQKLLSAFCRKHGMYPSFIVIAPFKKYIEKWGELPLPRIPRESFLHPDEKYYLLIGLSYHAIMPRNELNRLILRSIISKALGISWKSPLVSQLSGFFSTLYGFTKLSSSHDNIRHCKEALNWACSILSYQRHKLGLAEFLYTYYRLLMGAREESEYYPLAENVKDIIESNLSPEEKAQAFFFILKEIIQRDLFNENTFKKFLSQYSISLGPPHSEEKEKTWGRNWRAEKNKSNEISPEELQRLAKIDQQNALEIAKELDKNLEKKKAPSKQKEETLNKKQKSFLPGYSSRLRMYQKLLSKRRYIAAVRKVRLEKILASLDIRPSGQQALAIRGQTIWEIGDDETELNIEMSAETFGYVIPNLTTLRNLYEEDEEGKKKRGITHFEIIIDTSGSMNGQPLETAIDVAVALIEKARRLENSVALVTFSSGAWEALPPSFEYDALQDIVLRLMADGGTNLRGTLNIVDTHLSQVTGLGAIFIITDTAIWDINKPEVRDKLREWARKHPVYLLAITDELYEETTYALQNSAIRLLKISPSHEAPWEIVLDAYEHL
ncbi:MAG: vWA domain-containing protein [Candidatus Njordarchaeales archaeon]